MQCEGPMKLFFDNKLTIDIVIIMFSYDLAKHSEINSHFIKDKLDGGLIATSYILSGHQLTRVLTKGFQPTYLQFEML